MDFFLYEFQLEKMVVLREGPAFHINEADFPIGIGNGNNKSWLCNGSRSELFCNTIQQKHYNVLQKIWFREFNC